MLSLFGPRLAGFAGDKESACPSMGVIVYGLLARAFLDGARKSKSSEW